MRRRMYRPLAAAAVIIPILVPAGTATAERPVNVTDGRAAIGRFLHREVQAQGSAGYLIHHCGRLSQRTVWCRATEYGIPDDLDLWGAPFDLTYPMRAQRRDGRVKVWSPDIIFG